MTKIAIVYHSGYGHTARQAQAVLAGAASLAGSEVKLYAVADLDDTQWAELDAADAIVFGAPTYMGSASAAFKGFMDASSKAWFTQKWKNKIAGGFTNSASMNGDKLNTLVQFAVFAAQHGMIWVGAGVPPANSSKAQRNDPNFLGSYLGAMAQSPSDAAPDVAPPAGDLETARLYGQRVAEMTQQFVKGRG
jgi:NAD(P)H dehydrogenase (quinone)